MENETYTLTLRGVLSRTIKDEDVLCKTIDNLELYMRRYYSKDGHPAIVFDLNENEFEFTTVRSH